MIIRRPGLVPNPKTLGGTCVKCSCVVGEVAPEEAHSSRDPRDGGGVTYAIQCPMPQCGGRINLSAERTAPGAP